MQNCDDTLEYPNLALAQLARASFKSKIRIKLKVCLILLKRSLFAVATFELDYSRLNWYSGLCFLTELHCCTENPMVALCKTDKCSLLFSEQCTVVIRNLYTRIAVLWWRVCVSLKLCCQGAFAPVSISNGKKGLVSHPRPGSDSEARLWGETNIQEKTCRSF